MRIFEKRKKVMKKYLKRVQIDDGIYVNLTFRNRRNWPLAMHVHDEPLFTYMQRSRNRPNDRIINLVTDLLYVWEFAGSLSAYWKSR